MAEPPTATIMRKKRGTSFGIPAMTCSFAVGP